MNWLMNKIRPRRTFSGDRKWTKDELEAEMADMVAGRPIIPPPPPQPVPLDCLRPESCPALLGKRRWVCECGDVLKEEEKMTPSIHDPIAPFGAPAMKPNISDAYRSAAQDIATALDHIVRTCEEARREGLKLIDTLNEAGDWHDEFLSNYANIQTEAAATLRDAWKKQIEDLRQKHAALKATTSTEKEETA